MATKQKYKSTADVLKTILADSASEDDDSRELSSLNLSRLLIHQTVTKTLATASHQ